MPSINRKLGRLPTPVRDLERRLFLRNYDTGLPDPPPAVNGYQNLSRLTMAGNDQYGDCVFAGAMHMRQVWTANESTEIIPRDQDVVNAYLNYNNGQDNGANLGNVLKLWQNSGICGDRIGPYVAIDSNDIRMMQIAIWFFGGLWTGLNLPAQWKSDLTHWGNDNDNGGIAGGHCVNLCSYNQATETFGAYTWAHIVPLSFDMVPRYFDELYAILSPDWYAADGRAPNGLDLDHLNADLQLIRGN